MNKLLVKLLIFLRLRKPNFLDFPDDPEFLKKSTRKIFSPSLEVIKRIQSGGDFFVSLCYRKTNSKKEIKKFPVTIFDDTELGLRFKIKIQDFLDVSGVLYKESYGLTNELILKGHGEKFIIEKDSIKDFKTQFPAKPQFLEGVFLNLKSSGYHSEKTYRRIIIPSNDIEMIYPTSLLDYNENHMSFDISPWNKQSTLLGIPFHTTRGMYVELKIRNVKFHFYAIEQINSFVIESLEEISEIDFVNITYAIRVCFAFLSGKLYRNQVIYLCSNTSNYSRIYAFKYKVEEQSILTKNQIINHTLFFGQFDEMDGPTRELWKDYHTMFSPDVFSNFCEKVLESSEFLRSIELVINAGNINDPIQKGAMYSVSIETIAEYLKKNFEDEFKPIINKDIWASLLKSFKNDLNVIKNDIPANSYDMINSKLDNFNTLTNKEKLIKPFSLVGITLSDEEIQTLKQRNKYLHGGGQYDTKWQTELTITALKMHYLIGLLVLKYIGYTGHYINLSAWYLINRSEFREFVENFDIQDIEQIVKKLEQKKIDELNQIQEAKKTLEEYSKFLKASMEIQNLIMIIS